MTDTDISDYFFQCMRDPDLSLEELVSVLKAEDIKYHLWLDTYDHQSYKQIDELKFDYKNTEWKLYFKLPEGKIYRVKCLMYHNEENND